MNGRSDMLAVYVGLIENNLKVSFLSRVAVGLKGNNVKVSFFGRVIRIS